MGSELLDHGRHGDPFDHRYRKPERRSIDDVSVGEWDSAHRSEPEPRPDWRERKACVQGDAKARKSLPLFSGCFAYFPDALLAVAELSRIGNEQHNPGQSLHWDRSKSADELDALARHLLDAGTIDTDKVRHSTKIAWRALANLQKEIEASR